MGESVSHGWPSFRKEEVVEGNVIILDGGEMRSMCDVHLGHNLPDNKGDRYCINLVCIASKPGGPANASAFRALHGHKLTSAGTRLAADYTSTGTALAVLSSALVSLAAGAVD